MKFNRGEVLFIFAVFLMFALQGELAAQRTLTITPTGQSIRVDSTLDLTATALWNGNPYANRVVTFSVIQGDGSVSPLVGTTNANGEAYTVFTAGTNVGTNKVDGWYRYWQGGWQYVRDTVDIEVIAGDLDEVSVTPADTVVVVTSDIIVVAELLDTYGNHIDATDTTDVTFTSSGLGAVGSRSLTAENNIQMVYTTEDLMTVDTITATTTQGGFTDESYVTTIGGIPASAALSADDSTVVVSDTTEVEPLLMQLFDQYGNPSAYADYYGNGMYEVVFIWSQGAGIVVPDTANVDSNGTAGVDYLSSTVAGIYTVTGTSGTASDDIDIAQTSGPLAAVVLNPDSLYVPAGNIITLTAEQLDQYGNHLDAVDTTEVLFIKVDGDGTLGARLLSDSNNVKVDYTTCTIAADTAHIMAFVGGHADIVVVFNEAPLVLDHFSLVVAPDTLDVPEYTMVEISAMDAGDILINTYTNPDTVTLSLTGSTADSLQVAWIVLGDSSSGLSAAIPDNSFAAGMCTVYVANQKAETVSGVTATDTAGHTGTSTGITWLAIGVDSLIIELLSSKVDTISTNDTTNIQVTAIDNFGNVTSVGLPMDVGLSASEAGIVFPDGTIQSLQNSGDSFSLVAEEVCSGLIITVTDTADASIYGSSNPIEVVEGGAGVEELPAVSNISVKFGSGEILYSVAKEGKVEIKVYNKAGIEVGTLVEGVVEPGYYKASLQGLDLPNDIYFVVMKGPEIARSVKTVLIK